jgi:hypothetical protein
VLTPLLDVLERGEAQIVAPVINDEREDAQDSLRSLPTPREIILRRLLGTPLAVELPPGDLIRPDWIAGMFLLAQSSTFRALGGCPSATTCTSRTSILADAPDWRAFGCPSSPQLA